MYVGQCAVFEILRDDFFIAKLKSWCLYNADFIIFLYIILKLSQINGIRFSYLSFIQPNNILFIFNLISYKIQQYIFLINKTYINTTTQPPHNSHTYLIPAYLRRISKSPYTRKTPLKPTHLPNTASIEKRPPFWLIAPN